MLVAGFVRVMPIIPLPGRGRADSSFDDFHTMLGEKQRYQEKLRAERGEKPEP